MVEHGDLHWQLGAEIAVRPFEPRDSQALLALMTENREHLDRWLRWSSAIRELPHARQLVDEFAQKQRAGDGFHAGIWSGDRLAGGLVVWYVHAQNRNAEMGYWLGSNFVKKGIVTRVAARALEHLFEERELNRVELLCGVGNHASRSVAERLGFVLEGVRRQSHWITTRFVDHAVYGLLRAEWRGAGSAGADQTRSELRPGA